VAKKDATLKDRINFPELQDKYAQSFATKLGTKYDDVHCRQGATRLLKVSDLFILSQQTDSQKFLNDRKRVLDMLFA